MALRWHAVRRRAALAEAWLAGPSNPLQQAHRLLALLPYTSGQEACDATLLLYSNGGFEEAAALGGAVLSAMPVVVAGGSPEWLLAGATLAMNVQAFQERARLAQYNKDMRAALAAKWALQRSPAVRRVGSAPAALRVVSQDGMRVVLRRCDCGSATPPAPPAPLASGVRSDPDAAAFALDLVELY